MNIEFINENTVKINASMHWSGQRPPSPQRSFIKKSDVARKFNEKHRRYEIKNITGPDEICNFRGEGHSKGEWILTVEKTTPKKVFPRPTITTVKPSTKKTTKKGA